VSEAARRSRAAAGYLSKYLSKEMGRSDGLNRYDVGQGFQSKMEGLFAPTERRRAPDLWIVGWDGWQSGRCRLHLP
jgi:hypothetical protein